MFVFAATAHFNKMKHDLARMIPAYFPRLLLIVYTTGVLKLLLAAGLVLPEFRRVAGICLIALLIGMFIANVNAAQQGVTLRGKPPPLWLRAPMQILFVALLWWSTRAYEPASVTRRPRSAGNADRKRFAQLGRQLLRTDSSMKGHSET